MIIIIIIIQLVSSTSLTVTLFDHISQISREFWKVIEEEYMEIISF